MPLCCPSEEGLLPEGPLSFPKPLGSGCGGQAPRCCSERRVHAASRSCQAQNHVQLSKSDIPARLGDANGGWGAGGRRAATPEPHRCPDAPPQLCILFLCTGCRFRGALVMLFATER